MSEPPAFATWLLEQMASTAMIGDLVEAYHCGRSRRWFWRQAGIIVALRVLKDLRRHWFVACRAIAVAIAVLYMSHEFLSYAGFVGHIFRITNPLIGRWPSMAAVVALEALATCAPAGFMVAVTQRKCQGTMVVWYSVVLFAFLAWICGRQIGQPVAFAFSCEFTAFACSGALGGGLLGMALKDAHIRTEM